MQLGGAEKTLESGPLRLTYLPGVAGRIVEFSLGGRNVLSLASANALNYGSTYWTSPQGTWGWPPVPEIDSAPFSWAESLVGPAAPLGGTEVRLRKTYRAVSGVNAFDLVYELENTGNQVVSVAGWEISRVLPGGLTFFPTGEVELTPIAPHHVLRLEHQNGLSWFDHREFQPGLSRKVHADGREGFLAHVVRGPEGALLFLKTFADLSPAEQAPGEGEIEIFANEDGAYVEVEVQGRFAPLSPGNKSALCVRWTLAPLASDLIEPGARGELADFVRGLMRDVGYPSVR